MVAVVDQAVLGLRNPDALLFVVEPGTGLVALRSSHGLDDWTGSVALPAVSRPNAPALNSHWRNIVGHDHSDDR